MIRARARSQQRGGFKGEGYIAQLTARANTCTGSIQLAQRAVLKYEVVLDGNSNFINH
ncbi:hypothetical protein [Candidatus Regiella insecticola]|uniref:hypothetical protein n=1 Tax=Candidatus Regiella insecticola TaxID=138073 RepID=UPI0002DE9463|nr:hypothetical protein [Candidatus Regiella insecticola]